MNQLSIKSLAGAFGFVWGSLVLMVGLVNLIVPTFGLSFLWFVSSISPGFRAEPNIFSVAIGTGYAILEGMIVGGVIASIYNFLIKFEKV